MIIKIDGGDTFEGTIDQFKDCFFDNATVENIVSWAIGMDSTIEFIPLSIYNK